MNIANVNMQNFNIACPYCDSPLAVSQISFGRRSISVNLSCVACDATYSQEYEATDWNEIAKPSSDGWKHLPPA